MEFEIANRLLARIRRVTHLAWVEAERGEGLAHAHAVLVAQLLPIAMLYVRCKGGISHNPGESVRLDDVAYGADAFSRAVLAVARAQEAKE